MIPEIAVELRKAKSNGMREAANFADSQKENTGRLMSLPPQSAAAVYIRDECLRRADKIEKGQT